MLRDGKNAKLLFVERSLKSSTIMKNTRQFESYIFQNCVQDFESNFTHYSYIRINLISGTF